MKILDIVLIIVVPLTVTLLLVTIFVVRRAYIKFKRTEILQNIALKINKERMMHLEIDLVRVNAIAKQNFKHKALFESLENEYDEIDKLIGRLAVLHSSLHDEKFKYYDANGRLRIMTNKKFNLRIKDMEQKVDALNFHEQNFKKNVGHISNQDSILNSDFAYFQKFMRQALQIYSYKRILLDKISSKIDAMSKDISTYENEFEALVSKGHVVEANKALLNYSQMVEDFCRIISEGPTIQTWIQDSIPSRVHKITTLFHHSKDLNDGSLRLINFASSLEQVAIVFKNLKTEYENLDIEKAGKSIRQVLKALNTIEKQIIFENSSKNIFIQNFQSILEQVTFAFKHYNEIKDQTKTLVAKGKSISSDLRDLFEECKKVAQNLSEKTASFQSVIKDNSLAYSVKNFRAKNLIADTKCLLENCNEISQVLWSINIETSLARNKFKRAEASINELIANVKRQGILLSLDDQQKYGDISKEITNIAPLIKNDEITAETKKQVNNLVINATSLYKAIGANIQFAEITANLIREFSSQRAIDQNANITFAQVEKLYLDGMYADALNLSIKYLEERKR